MTFHYPLMAISGSYDILNESSACIPEVEIDAVEEDFPKVTSRMGRNWRNFFRRRRTLEDFESNEVATTPTGYWDISADQFSCALNLKPQFRFARSVYSNIKCSKSDEALNRYALEFEPSYRQLECISGITAMDGKGKEKKRVRFTSMKSLKSLIPSKSPYTDIKILIVGDKNSGKSAIIERFVYGTFSSSKPGKTNSYETKLMKLHNNKQFCLHLFEVSGDISNAVVSPTCVSNSIGALVVCDINETKAFCSIQKWKRNIDTKAKQTKYGEIPCILLANKCDSTDNNFNMCELDTYCSNQGILGWFDTSAKNDFNIKNAIVCLMQIIIADQHNLKAPIAVDSNKQKYITSNLNFNFRRMKTVSCDEEITTIL